MAAATPLLPTATATPWQQPRGRDSTYTTTRSLPRHLDVVIVGAGIAGLTSALLLRRAGLEVALVDAGTIGSGVTGLSTAKVTPLHGAIHHKLRDRHGAEVASVYAAANSAGFALVDALTDELRVRVERRSAITYTEHPEGEAQIEHELAAARAAGLAVTERSDADVPFPFARGVELSDQLQIDPVAYLNALAEAFGDAGGHVVTGVRVSGFADVRGRRVHTERGPLPADHVIITTGIPMTERGLYSARLEAMRSYVVAARAPDVDGLDMYLSVDTPTRSVRTARDTATGHPLVLVGGNGHLVGDDPDPIARQTDLARWAARHFDAPEIAYRWSAQDYVSTDLLPFVGPMWPGPCDVSVATGFGKWGFTNATAAAIAFRDELLGEPPPWAEAFNPTRLGGWQGLRSLTSHNSRSARHFVVDRIALPQPDGSTPHDGEGRLQRRGLKIMGIATSHLGDEDTCEVQARCTHLGGVVRWNNAERSWDCPLHGSRFGPCGAVLQGPATDPLPHEQAHMNDSEPG